MEIITLLIGGLYFFLLLGCCTVLLVRGVTHTFVGLFACGAFLHLIQMLGFSYLRQAPGGYSANLSYVPILSAVASFGTICFAVGFVLLTMFLLRNKAAN